MHTFPNLLAYQYKHIANLLFNNNYIFVTIFVLSMSVYIDPKYNIFLEYSGCNITPSLDDRYKYTRLREGKTAIAHTQR
jgi:hypothetical protein